ncbi:MAG: hypothetical protein GC206_16745 [Alphaproteobacteria bacterium]|nr:hypothetical protein [Alphaproteobacteria bacterium]
MTAIRGAIALACALALLLLSACSLSDADEARTHAPMAAMQARDMTALYDMLSPELRNQETRATLETMMAMVPQAAPTRVRIVSWRVRTMDRARAIEALSIYEYPDRALEVRTLMVQPDGAGAAELQAFLVTPIDAAAIEAHALRLDRVGSVHVAMALAALASLGLMLFAAVAVVRTRGFPVKWLFAILAFFGIGAAQLNWTTGEAAFFPLSINLVGFGFMRAASPLAPWMLNFTLPVGAVIVLALVVRHRARRDEAPA